MDPENISRKWYYARGGEKYGPLPGARILSMVRSGELPPDTLAWSRGMENWTPLEETRLWSADAGKSVSESAAPGAPEADELDPHMRWIGRMAWLFEILAKEGSVVLLLAGGLLAYLDILPVGRITVGVAGALAAVITFIVCRTSAATLHVQRRMARRQRRLMDEVQMLAHGADAAGNADDEG